MIKGNRLMKKFIIILLLLSANFLIAQTEQKLPVGVQEESAYYKQKALQYKRLSVDLIRLMDENEKNGASSALDLAKRKGFTIKDNKLILRVEATKNNSAWVKSYIASMGAEVISSYHDILRIKIDVGSLKQLNDCTNIKSTGKLNKPKPNQIIGEEVVLTGAANLHNNGFTGNKINVAIIDGGFYYLDLAVSSGVLPGNIIAYDFSGRGLETDTQHGTAVAEVVHEMAPNCQLYLLKIGDDVDLGNAEQYCVNNGIHIINHSMGWISAENGTGEICDIANDAFNNNILWVNSAGNQAGGNWVGTFDNSVSSISNAFNHSAPNTTINIISNIGNNYTFNQINYVNCFLIWDEPWGSANNDFDIYLYESSDGTDWTLDQIGDYYQAGYPLKEIYYQFLSPATYYGVSIIKHPGAPNVKLRLLSWIDNDNFEFNSKTNSLLSPADASGVLTVGAINYSNWTKTNSSAIIEYFSSQGPTLDGRKKPDICGVDNNANFIFGRFLGTSSASPCVAGSAALVWNALGFSGSPNTVKQYLINNAIHLGTGSGQNNTFGNGRVNLNLTNLQKLYAIAVTNIAPPQDPPGVNIYNNLVNLNDPTKNVLRFVFTESGLYTISIYNVRGEIINTWKQYYRSYQDYDWDVKNAGKIDNGNLYFVKFKSDSVDKVFKFLVVK